MSEVNRDRLVSQQRSEEHLQQAAEDQYTGGNLDGKDDARSFNLVDYVVVGNAGDLHVARVRRHGGVQWTWPWSF